MNLLILHAHPRPSQSRIVAALLSRLSAQPGAEIRSLYALYPDFDIDVESEQRALTRADLIVWLTPVYWYSVPALMKHWIDQVLTHGWAYGEGTQALRNKGCWWICSAGAHQDAYSPLGMHGRAFSDYVHPLEHTARFCGMRWLEPFVVFGGHSQESPVLQQTLNALSARLNAPDFPARTGEMPS